MTTKIIALLAMFALFVSGVRADTYNVVTNQLTIPSITIGNTNYTNVVVTVGTVNSFNTGIAPLTDVYDAAANQLTIPFITVAGVTYTNVVLAVGQVLNVGGSMTVGVCPVAAQSDVWANVRMGCLQVGQQVISISANATGVSADTAFTIAEAAYDPSWTSINGGKERYFRHFLCVKNAPLNINHLSLSTDLTIAMGLGTNGRALPNGIVFASFPGIVDILGNAVVMTTCDAAIHPVIVNYLTGKIESVNPAALASLTIYDY